MKNYMTIKKFKKILTDIKNELTVKPSVKVTGAYLYHLVNFYSTIINELNSYSIDDDKEISIKQLTNIIHLSEHSVTHQDENIITSSCIHAAQDLINDLIVALESFKSKRKKSKDQDTNILSDYIKIKEEIGKEIKLQTDRLKRFKDGIDNDAADITSCLKEIFLIKGKLQGLEHSLIIMNEVLFGKEDK